MKVNKLCKDAHENARQKGFWDMEIRILRKINNALEDPVRFDEEEVDYIKRIFKTAKIMLIVSELGEAVEALRKNDLSNFYEEIADSIIRTGDFCGGYEINIEHEISKKMEINKKRHKLHGKRF